MTQSSNDVRTLQELEIIKKILAGEKDQFRHFVEQYGPLVHGLIARQIRDSSLTQDLFQDAFVRAFRSIGSFRGQAKFSTWISRIALNVCNSYFESRHHKTSRATDELVSELVDELPEAEVDPEVFSETDLETLHECLGKLKSHYRDTVAICLLEQKSYREASEILEVPMGTIGSRLSKAIGLLKRCFFGEHIHSRSFRS